MRTFLVSLLLFISGCSLDAELQNLESIGKSLPDDGAPHLKPQRAETDFVSGEIVTTGNGVIFKGSFGEISEKKILTTGVTFEGAFYE